LTAAGKGLAGVEDADVPPERLGVFERESIFVLADPRIEVPLSLSKDVLDSGWWPGLPLGVKIS
jgi:hypothetical protein